MSTCVLDLCNTIKECCKCNDLYILQDRSAVKFDPIDESKKEVRTLNFELLTVYITLIKQ